jgi:hypothetical protein
MPHKLSCLGDPASYKLVMCHICLELHNICRYDIDSYLIWESEVSVFWLNS